MNFPMRAAKKRISVSTGGRGRGKDIGYGISDMGVRKAEGGRRNSEKNLSELCASAVRNVSREGAKARRDGGVGRRMRIEEWEVS